MDETRASRRRREWTGGLAESFDELDEIDLEAWSSLGPEERPGMYHAAMVDLPAHLRDALERLLRDSAATKRVSIDAIGEAIGTGAVDATQIETMLDALEREGRTVVAPEQAMGIENLRKVIPAARALGGELGRAARVSEIASRAGLAEEEVRRALLLAKVMGR